MAYLYRHIRLDKNEVFYIGIGVRKNYLRAKTIQKRNCHWKNIVAKSRWEWEIMLDDISIEYAKEKEIEFIALYGRSDLNKGTLANMTNGGDGIGGMIISNKTRAEMSIRNIGKKLSQDHKDKISKSHKGKIFSKETIAKMSAAKAGKKQSEETINKRKARLVGNKSRIGQKASPELRQKQIEGQRKRREKEAHGKTTKN